MKNEKLRNIAIIAHVDHGKTSLVNEMLKQGGVFRSNQTVQDRVMDSGDIERERGITILAKNCSLMHKGVKINLVDTPGHADFGGEVERSLKMVDGVLLVVDAFEGPMPQTRFVLEKALALNLKVIVVVNKIDKPEARLQEVQDEVLELLMDLNATDEQLDSPFVFASARNGSASLDINSAGENMMPLLDKILEYIPAPEGDPNGEFQMICSSTETNDYVGKMAIGKITRGTVHVNDNIVITNYYNEKPDERSKVTALYEFEGMKKVAHEQSDFGDIVCIAGSPNVRIGDTLCASSKVEALPFVKISEPSVEMTFSVNNSPFAGKEGKFVTSRHLRARLLKEAEKDLSLKVYETDTTEAFRVCGRGEMHLSILIENMRREGYEFQVSMPKVLYKEENGVKLEPIDKLVVDVPQECMGVVMNKMGIRKGEFQNMTTHGSRLKMEFLIPSRGLFGYKSEFLTDTKGEGILTSVHHSYEPFKGEIVRRNMGSLIAFENGTSVVYGLFNAQERGDLFIGPNTDVYAGMVVGRNPKNEDLVVNVCKEKHLSNCRSSSSDDAMRLTPPIKMSLEEAIEFLADDELLEVTPENLRIRKVILDQQARAKAKFAAKQNAK
ncbi:MAG: translational GTPase TypA [Christensenellales bacterium]